MLPSYCIPAQRLAVTAIARGASALQRTFTALATPWDAAVLTPAPTPCLVGSVGGGVGVSCCQVPNTENQCNFGRFWHRTEINIARVPGYEIANCLSEIVRHTLSNSSYVFIHPARNGLYTHAAAPWPRGWRNGQYVVKLLHSCARDGSCNCRACCICT